VFARIRPGVIGGEEGIRADLGCMLRGGALCFGDVSQAVGVDLM
jgi:hypothetical protein